MRSYDGDDYDRAGPRRYRRLKRSEGRARLRGLRLLKPMKSPKRERRFAAPAVPREVCTCLKVFH